MIEQKVYVVSGLGVIFSVVIIFSGVRYFSEKAEISAFEQMEKSITRYKDLSPGTGAEKAYQDVRGDFETILDKYSQKYGGRLARIAYAHMAYMAGDFNRSAELYEQALREIEAYPSLKNIIISGLGYACEGKKDYPSAVKYFDMIASGSEPVLKAEAMFNLGRLYAEMGNADQSRAAFEKLITEYPDSLYKDIAQEKAARGKASS